MIKYNIAIEIGSTNTVIYKRNLGVVLKEPSLVAVNTDGKKKVVHSVGLEAKALLGKTSDTVQVHEPIIEGVIYNKQLAHIMLKEFLYKAKIYRFSRLKVLVCVPVGLTSKEKNALLNLLYGLNFHTVTLIPSSVASLLGMEADINLPNSHMIVNIGGGISDIAIVTKGKIVRGCSVTISGKTLMSAIDNYLRNQFAIVVKENTKIEIMHELVSLLKHDTNTLTVGGFDTDTNNPKSVTLSTSDFYTLSINFFDKLVECIETLLGMSTSEVIADVSRLGIYVCGGLSKTTGLEKFLRERLNYPIYIDTDPSLTTINGMGVLIDNPKLVEKVAIKK